MSFSPDINKQAREVIFSRRLQRSNHLSLTFNGASVTLSGIQKHLGMFLDSWLQWVAGCLGLALVFVWGNAQSWCGGDGGGVVSIYRDFASSVGEAFILAGRLCAGL